MNDMLDRLLRQLDARGLRVEPGDRPGVLKLCGPTAEKTPDVMDALKAFKPQLLERFGGPPMATPDPPTEARPDSIATEPVPNPPVARPAAGPTVCPDCRADIYPAATRADTAQVCDRTPCHYLPPKLWRGGRRESA